MWWQRQETILVVTRNAVKPDKFEIQGTKKKSEL
jgi:hypothetical protein